ncbi:protease SohB [Spongisporangium articulatum]|uniref:Protease SohB n=1 Tax=Spongisporangium articulatum TaxID=3362603 RepID=A0ABW8AJ38_9ACTN
MGDYLLFLAKTVTVLLAVALALGVTAGLVFRLAGAGRRQAPRPSLRVTEVGSRYDKLARDLRSGMVPAGALRAERRRRNREDKARRMGEARAASQGEKPPKPRVFVLSFHGDVRASRVSALREEVTAILMVANDDDEVVVKLQNPGGLVNDQGLAASQLLRLRDHAIPLTVAVDTVAASGGYMMACVADRIIAAPFAVVGSIGVVTQIPNFHRLLDRFGVDVEQFTGGRYKRTVTMLTPTTDEAREKLKEQIEDTHDLFKEFVADHRPQLDLERVATGEYWYGARAIELGLVDELRTSDDYLVAARERADIYEVSYRQPVGMRDRLLGLAGRVAGTSGLQGVR